MHIKTLTIQGFKSYRDVIAIEPFSPRHNVVVGRNGSGKSNFFLAIRFVLSDAYTAMGREERQSLLHEGTSNQTTMSAFVEIVFDNSDHRFPTGNDEVYLRRTIGQKKDEYSLDRKSSTKAEVMNLLESAGFSRSNPYYIVPQGRITALTNMKEGERLNLLKEVAGTKVYEQRRQESLKIMEDTESKREKIVELLDKIEERLSELEEEKKELKEFNNFDRERRCLEYALYARDLEDVDETLEQIDSERRKDVDTSNEKRAQFNAREAEIRRLESELIEARIKVDTLTIQASQSASEMTDLIKAKTELECLIEDAESAGKEGEAARQANEAELAEVEARMDEIRDELTSLDPELEELVAEEREKKQSLDDAQGRLQLLYAKQGRSRQFSTQAERDAFLNKEIKSTKAAHAAQADRAQEISGQIETARQDVEEAAERRQRHEEELNNLRETISSAAQKQEELKRSLETKIEQRKVLWREDGKLRSTVSSAKNEKDTAERSLAGMMDKDTSRGLSAVMRIAREQRIEGVYGPLYSLLDIDERWKVAVEVTAGNSLFHVVVDSDSTASRVLQHMNREKAGRVTFMPLNRLSSASDVRFPEAEDCLPLIDRLRFDPAYKPAFEQVFGRTVVCPDLATAADYTRSHALNAITLDGDRADRKGVLTGGYYDVRRSRLDVIKAVRNWTEKFEAHVARHQEVTAGITRLDQEITALQGEMQKTESSRRQAAEARQPLINKVGYIQREEEQLGQRLSQLQEALAEAQQDARDLEAKIKAYETELKSKMTQNLSTAEQKLLTELTAQVDKQKAESVAISKRRTELASQKRMLEIELSDDLRRRREDLKSLLESRGEDGVGGDVVGADTEARRERLRNLEQSIDQLQGVIESTEAELEDLNRTIADSTVKLEEAQTAQRENTRGILKTQKAAERHLTKRQTLLARKEECNKSIRDLGILPQEAFSKYIRERPEKIVKHLHKVNEQLKAYSHVNKKAGEQFASFTKQRDSLLTRRDELDESGASIQELIETLDQRKDEAIERTFKQVSKYFAEVFERLVPAGKGRLKMQKRIDQDEDVDMEETAESRRSGIDSYTGVAIEVSFNSKVHEGLRIQQLSGGQKSLVALATVFAIQKCDPAPFYLFDEIDANLDAQYRTAVAAMIHELSSSAQFITTTFRPEMLAQADKFYGVIFGNDKVSRIETIDKERAQEFVDTAA